MSYCRSCGSELKDEAVFCVKCGTKVDGEITQEISKITNSQLSTGLQDDLKRKNTHKYVGLTAFVVVAFVAVVIIVKILGIFIAPAYERPLNKLETAIEKADFDMLLDAYPKYVTEQIKGIAEMYDNKDDYMDEMLGSIEDTYGKRIKVNIDVVKKKKMVKNDLEDAEDYIESVYDEKVNIIAGYTLDIEMEIKGSDDKETKNSQISVIKIGSKWYVQDMIGL